MEKTVFLTGASRGIGRSIALMLSDLPYNLVLVTKKNEELLLELKDEILKKYKEKRIITFTGDITNEDFLEHVKNETKKAFGKVDVLINNAGISYVGLLHEMTLSDWNRVLSVNLTSCFLTSRAFLPEMIRDKSGRIINISSYFGQEGGSMEVAYSASKGGVDSFTKALSKELSPSLIPVNAISVGVCDTSMNDNLTMEEKKNLSKEIPMGRFCTPDEVAELVKFLLSAPVYITGEIIGIKGGI